MKELDPTPIVQESRELSQSVKDAQRAAELKNAAIRQAERQEKMEAWQDPDAMAYRKILSDKQAFESLQRMKADGQCEEETPIPLDSELPSYMRGQAASTVRAWARQQP